MSLTAFLNKLNRKDTRIFPRLNFKTKNFIIFLMALTLAASTVSVLAQEQRNVLKEKQDAIKEGSNQESWLDEAFASNGVTGIRALVGDIPDDVLEGKASRLSYYPGGAIGAANNMVASLYKPQASGIEYIAQMKDNFLGKPAYAQGTGFRGLQPLLPIWRGFRNVVYLLSSLIFVIVGILIILRVKISPQAVVSIQNSIPNIITTLLLVTFSYAIAGLLIDLTYIFQGVTISTLFMATGNPTNLLHLNPAQWAANQINHLFGGNAATYGMGDLMANNGFLQTFDLVARLVPGNIVIVIAGLIGGVIIAITSLPTAGASLPIGVIIGSQAAIIVLLVFLVLVFINLLSLLFGLIRVYINVLTKVIFAPLEIGLGAFPGSKTGFSTWLWDLISNLAVFPGVLVFLVTANVIIETIASSNQGSMWTPPLMGSAPGGVFGSFVGNELIAGLVGLGAFLLVSRLPTMIPQVIFAIKPSPWGTAIGEAPGDIIGLPMKGLTAYSTINKARQSYYEAELARRSMPQGPTTPPAAAPTPVNPPAPAGPRNAPNNPNRP